jgi:hypothetical protein
MRFGVAAMFLLGSCTSEAVREPSPTPDAVREPSSAPGDLTPVAAAHRPAGASLGDSPSESSSSHEPCGESSPTGTFTTPPEVDCPIPAPQDRCPDACASMPGWRFDEARQCYEEVVVACLPLYCGTYTLASDLHCMRRDDGVIYKGSATVTEHLGPRWSGCSLGDKYPSGPKCN